MGGWIIWGWLLGLVVNSYRLLMLNIEDKIIRDAWKTLLVNGYDDGVAGAISPEKLINLGLSFVSSWNASKTSNSQEYVLDFRLDGFPIRLQTVCFANPTPHRSNFK
jgi:hypothetical protein